MERKNAALDRAGSFDGIGVDQYGNVYGQRLHFPVMGAGNRICAGNDSLFFVWKSDPFDIVPQKDVRTAPGIPGIYPEWKNATASENFRRKSGILLRCIALRDGNEKLRQGMNSIAEAGHTMTETSSGSSGTDSGLSGYSGGGGAGGGGGSW